MELVKEDKTRFDDENLKRQEIFAAWGGTEIKSEERSDAAQSAVSSCRFDLRVSFDVIQTMSYYYSCYPPDKAKILEREKNWPYDLAPKGFVEAPNQLLELVIVQDESSRYRGLPDCITVLPTAVGDEKKDDSDDGLSYFHIDSDGKSCYSNLEAKRATGEAGARGTNAGDRVE